MRNPGSLRRTVGRGVAAISMATAMIGGLQVVDQQPAEALPAHCSGIYNDLYDDDCRTDRDPYNDPCNLAGRYFDPFACYYPGYFTDPPTGGGGGGGSAPPALPALTVGQRVPADRSEAQVNGPISVVIRFDSLAYHALLITNTNPDIRFKNEENTDAFPNNENTDQLMTPELKERLDRLAMLVKAEFPGFKLQVNEAYDIDYEHPQPPGTCLETDACTSLHYEGRAADMVIVNPNAVPVVTDVTKLGRLGQLAVDAGFPWVKYEGDRPHIHASVPKSPEFPETPPPPPPPAPTPRPGCSGCTYEEP